MSRYALHKEDIMPSLHLQMRDGSREICERQGNVCAVCRTSLPIWKVQFQLDGDGEEKRRGSGGRERWKVATSLFATYITPHLTCCAQGVA
mmetsp:Transcript_31542/g.82377  ORF Transcript_31542/g.82377 Transcript_31542/m.82377 type:complete len:91 (+) Transcript_31542:160-432(+)